MRRTQSDLLKITAAIVVAALHVSWLTGCAWPQRVAGVIHEDAGGVVYLEEVPDLAFKASHPVQLEQATISRLLSGVTLAQPVGSAAGSKASGSPSPAVFSKKQIQFLSPLLTAALSKADPEHRIVFRSVATGSSTRVTAGTLFAHESMLYVTLTHFREQVTDKNAAKASFTLPPSPTMASLAFKFVPEVAGGPANSLPPGAPNMPLLTTLAVDVEKLAQASPSPVQQVSGDAAEKSKPAAAGPAGPPQSAEIAAPAAIEAAAKAYRVKLQELQDANRLLGQRMAENQALQEDLRILRDKLAEHRALIDRLKQSNERSKKKGR